MPIDNHTHSHASNDILAQLILVSPLVLLFVVYMLAVYISNRHKRKWPIHRPVLWTIGILSAVVTVTGPLADLAHINFTAHMIGHILLGMLAPLLLALAAPMTLILRTLPVTTSRRMIKVLGSKPIRVLSNPIITSLLNVGGLWLLYTTDLFMMMHEYSLVYLLVHLHIFLAGYFFTISFIYIDPIAHRTSFVFRSIVLLLALTAHSILSKYIYSHPPKGVSAVEAELGAKIMYYGGDVIEIVLVFILCQQWFKNSRPKVKELKQEVYL
jgi:putative membrane protein